MADVRLATKGSEREAIYAFRYGVYCEDHRADRPGLDHERKVFREALDDDRAIQLYVPGDAGPVGVFRINVLSDAQLVSPLREWLGIEHLLSKWQPGELAIGSRLMTAPQCRNGHVAAQLLSASYAWLCNRGVRIALMYCRPSLAAMYAPMGFRRYGRDFHSPISGHNIPLALVLGDRAHLQQVRSFVEHLAPSANDDEAALWFSNLFAEWPNTTIGA